MIIKLRIYTTIPIIPQIRPTLALPEKVSLLYFFETIAIIIAIMEHGKLKYPMQQQHIVAESTIPTMPAIILILS